MQCVACHEALWEKTKQDNQTAGKERLGQVVLAGFVFRPMTSPADSDYPCPTSVSTWKKQITKRRDA